MERWREAVGAPVALDLNPSGDARPDGSFTLVILSWNVWIGQGRLRELIARIRNGDFRHLGVDPGAALIVLLQEAYRSDATVPPAPQGRARGVLPARRQSPEDVVDTARELGLSL